MLALRLYATGLKRAATVNLGMQSFVWARYTATVLSRVWSNTARLPPREQLWKDFWATVKKRGGLKSGFQWLIGNENEGQYALQFASFTVDGLRRVSEILRRVDKFGRCRIRWRSDRDAPRPVCSMACRMLYELNTP